MSFSADDTIHKPLEVGELLGKDPTTTAFDETMKFVVEKEKTEAALEEKTERWVYLTDLAEQIEAQNQK